MTIFGEILLVVGAVFILLAGVGVVRFPDIYSRMHAAAKAPALGVLLIGLGTMLTIQSVQATVTVILVIALQLITGPVGTHMIGRTVYRNSDDPLIGIDEFASRQGENGDIIGGDGDDDERR